jgi:hypothetical protein
MGLQASCCCTRSRPSSSTAGWCSTSPPRSRTEPEVELFAVDDDPALDEKARRLRSIEDGFEDFEHGDHMDGFEFIAELRAKREAASR